MRNMETLLPDDTHYPSKCFMKVEGEREAGATVSFVITPVPF